MKWFDTIACASLLAITASGVSAQAASTTGAAAAAGSASGSWELSEADAGNDPWRVDFNSWIWMIGVNGTVGARGSTADVDASFGDILDASDSIFAFSGRLEVGYGRWAGYVDGWYGKMGADDQSGPLGIASVDLTFEQIVFDFGAMYRLTEWESKEPGRVNRMDGFVDLYAGGRYNNLDLELDPANLPAVSRDRGWMDPIVGARVILPFSERLHLRLNGDIGGFGANSDLTWSCTGVLGVDFELLSMPATFYAGYRAIGWDYTDGSGAEQFVWDVTMHGPILGLSIWF